MKPNQFLQELRAEAARQAKLEQTRILPKELDGITSYIAAHPFWIVLALSACSALAVELTQGRWV